MALFLVCGSAAVMAQKAADITFKQTEINLGTFTRDNGIRTCEFKFVNSGNANLFIHQAFASCGCTVPEYTQQAIAPGDSGIVKVTYNGKTKAAGVFKKSITIHSNAKTETVRLYISGEMTEGKEGGDK